MVLRELLAPAVLAVVAGVGVCDGPAMRCAGSGQVRCVSGRGRVSERLGIWNKGTVSGTAWVSGTAEGLIRSADQALSLTG